MSCGRYAPSPTGELHLGNLRTALVAWLAARSVGARFLLRIEDLDPDRSRDEWVEVQLGELGTIGIDWDGEPVRQSDRGPLYGEALDQLRSRGLLYECFCTRREIREAASAPHDPLLPENAYPGTCLELTAAERSRRIEEGRRPALRVRAEAARIGFRDGIHGDIEGVVDDFVVCRNDGVFSYNLAVAVDDADQGVTGVVRGDDLIDSTSRQIWLYRQLGLTEPVAWHHLPLLYGEDGERLAKRHGGATLEERLALGETVGEVVGRLASGIGLLAPGRSVEAVDLVESFSWRSVAEAARAR
jgi:glutamyl-tRNA synthetase